MPKYRCPYCGSERKPRASVSGGLQALGRALMVLAILILCCPAIIFMPFLLKQADEFCPDCGRKIG